MCFVCLSANWKRTLLTSRKFLRVFAWNVFLMLPTYEATSSVFLRFACRNAECNFFLLPSRYLTMRLYEVYRTGTSRKQSWILWFFTRCAACVMQKLIYTTVKNSLITVWERTHFFLDFVSIRNTSSAVVALVPKISSTSAGVASVFCRSQTKLRHAHKEHEIQFMVAKTGGGNTHLLEHILQIEFSDFVHLRKTWRLYCLERKFFRSCNWISKSNVSPFHRLVKFSPWEICKQQPQTGRVVQLLHFLI